MAEQAKKNVFVFKARSACARFAQSLAVLANQEVTLAKRGKDSNGRNPAALTPAMIGYVFHEDSEKDDVTKSCRVFERETTFHFFNCTPTNDPDDLKLWGKVKFELHDNLMEFLRFLEREFTVDFSEPTRRAAELVWISHKLGERGLQTLRPKRSEKAHVHSLETEYPD